MISIIQYIKRFFTDGVYIASILGVLSFVAAIYFAIDASKIAATKDVLSVWNFAVPILFIIASIVLLIVAKIANDNIKVDLVNKTIEVDEK